MQKYKVRYCPCVLIQKYIYTMEYYSAIKKNTFESVPMRWMKLEPIIQKIKIFCIISKII